jgi:hypothetical protein
MDADFIFNSEIQSLGYSNVDEINPSHLVDLALRFAIWPSVVTYKRAPWLAPFAIRRVRNRVEINASGPKRDLWGLPTESGYFTDDNSLIKSFALKRPLTPVLSPYGTAKVKSGLVCCHIWPRTTHSPLLFSFVPNLVWLPKSLARYSDVHSLQEPHAVHFALQQVSKERYSTEHSNRRVERAWSLLESPASAEIGEYSITEINDDEKIIALVHKRIHRMIDFLEATLDPDSGLPVRFSKRYHAGVGTRIDKSVWTVQDWLTIEARAELVRELKECL